MTGAGAVAFGKSRLIWLSTRKKMESDIETILSKILEHYKDHPIGPQIEQAYRSKTGPLLERLDESLADRLDEAVNATDPAIRANLVGQAKELIVRYQKTVESEPTLAQLDTNPFVPVALVKTLTTTLNALAATVR